MTVYTTTPDVSGLPDGDYDIVGVVTDTGGLTGVSPPVTITVQNPTPAAWIPHRERQGFAVPIPLATDAAGRTAMWARIVATGAVMVSVTLDWNALQPTNVTAASLTTEAGVVLTTEAGATLTPESGAAGQYPTGQNDTFGASGLADLDAFMDDAASHNIVVWGCATNTPPWARPSTPALPGYVTWGDVTHVPPEAEPQNGSPDFANLCWLIADRYATRNPGVLVAIGVWEQPNLREYWLQPPGSQYDPIGEPAVDYTPDARRYRQMVIGASQAVKTGAVHGRPDRTGHPEVHITAGRAGPASGAGNGGDYAPLTFLQQWATGAAAAAFDGLDHQPYAWQAGPADVSAPNGFQDMHALWARLVAIGRQDALIWISRIGMPSRPDASGTDPSSPYAVGGYATGATRFVGLYEQAGVVPNVATAAVRAAESGYSNQLNWSELQPSTPSTTSFPASAGDVTTAVNALNLTTLLTALNNAAASPAKPLFVRIMGGVGSTGGIRQTPQWLYDRCGTVIVSAKTSVPAWFDNTADVAAGVQVLSIVDGNVYQVSNATTTPTSIAASVFTKTSHGFPNGHSFKITNAGSLTGTGWAVNNKVFVVNRAANTFQVSATSGGAPITLSGTLGTTSFGNVYTAGGGDPGAWNLANNATWETIDPTTIHTKSDGTGLLTGAAGYLWVGVASTQAGPSPIPFGAPDTNVFGSHAGTAADPWAYTPAIDATKTDYASAYAWFQYVLARAKITLSAGTWYAGDTTVATGDGTHDGTVYTVDSCPALVCVPIFCAMNVFAEPMSKHTKTGEFNTARNRTNWVAAATATLGTSVAATVFTADKAAFNAGITAQMAAWRSTSQWLSLLPWDLIDGTQQQTTGTLEVTVYARQVAAAAGVVLYVGHNNLATDEDFTSGVSAIIKSLPGPYAFQSHAASGTGAVFDNATLTTAVDRLLTTGDPTALGATAMLEINATTAGAMTSGQMATQNARLTASGTGWDTDPTAINYTLAAQRVVDYAAEIRDSSFYDVANLKSILGPCCWNELFDAVAGIGSDWPAGAVEDHFGFYEYGSSRFNGPVKGTLVSNWVTAFAPDVTPPSGSITSPAGGATLVGLTTIVIAAADNRDQVVERVDVLVDGTAVGQAIPSTGYRFALPTDAFDNGVHAIGGQLTDVSGNAATIPTHLVTFANTPTVPPPPPPSMPLVFPRPFTATQLLDLSDPGIGRVGYTIQFELVSGASRTPLYPQQSTAPTIEFQTDRNIMRTLNGLRLNPSDLAAINPLSDQLQVWMLLETDDRFPLGRFVFGDYSQVPFSYGRERATNMFDRTFILDQGIERTFSIRPGDLLLEKFTTLAFEVGINPDDLMLLGPGAASSVIAPLAWPTGTSRYDIMKTIAAMMGCYAPFFDAIGRLVLKAIPDLTSVTPDFRFNYGGRIIDGSLTQSDQSYKAPNRYIITGGSGTQPVSAYFDIPADAPHSIANRGYVVSESENMPGIESSAAALAAAIGKYVTDVRTYSVAEWDTPTDPRHDAFNVLEVVGDTHLETGWTIDCQVGGKMHHRASRIWTGAAA